MKLAIAGLLVVLATPVAADDSPMGKPIMRRPPPRATLDPSSTYAIPIDRAIDAVSGVGTAKVTMVVASDYACPYCEKIGATIVELQKHYGNDLRLVYKQFIVHPQIATAYALAACASVHQGKFEALDPKLWALFDAKQFDQNSCWETKDGCANVTAAANAVGMDRKHLVADMVACKGFIEKAQAQLSTDFGVGGIPQVFINGRPVTGAQPYDNFAKVIDDELGKANLRIKQGAKPATYYDDWVVGKGLKKLAPAVPNMPSPDPCSG